MTTLAAFYAEISAEVRRGTSLDASIPRKVQQAVRWIESQHTFKHMEKYVELEILSTGTEPRALPLPAGFKSMLTWRILLESKYYNIIKVDAYDVSEIDTTRPKAYWQDGMDYFWLDSEPDQDYESEMNFIGYTTLPTDTAESPYIIQEFGALILYQTMVLMAPLMRDATTLQFYKGEREEMIKAAIDADVEARQSAETPSVQYGHEFSEQINLENSND